MTSIAKISIIPLIANQAPWKHIKTSKAVIPTALLVFIFNLKSNTMKKHSANIVIIPSKHGARRFVQTISVFNVV